mmetsp:Transcript_5364/g.8240  ORF Transcript_5364/g.8240 Transcript_5364/m.8240 type:complete len:222 (-) Transcript_5364:630-1295(-)
MNFVPKYSDVLCLDDAGGVMEMRNCAHLIINYPGTDLFIETLRTFQPFFNTICLQRQKILCKCIIDGLASNSAKPINFFRLNRSNNQWTPLSPKEASEVARLALQCGLSEPKRAWLDHQTDEIIIRSVQDKVSGYQRKSFPFTEQNQLDASLLDKSGQMLPISIDSSFVCEESNQPESETNYANEIPENDDFMQSIEVFFSHTDNWKEESLEPIPISCFHL